MEQPPFYEKLSSGGGGECYKYVKQICTVDMLKQFINFVDNI